jgi:hypothetical protein
MKAPATPRASSRGVTHVAPEHFTSSNKQDYPVPSPGASVASLSSQRVSSANKAPATPRSSSRGVTHVAPEHFTSSNKSSYPFPQRENAAFVSAERHSSAARRAFEMRHERPEHYVTTTGGFKAPGRDAYTTPQRSAPRSASRGVSHVDPKHFVSSAKSDYTAPPPPVSSPTGVVALPARRQPVMTHADKDHFVSSAKRDYVQQPVAARPASASASARAASSAASPRHVPDAAQFYASTNKSSYAAPPPGAAFAGTARPQSAGPTQRR